MQDPLMELMLWVMCLVLAVNIRWNRRDMAIELEKFNARRGLLMRDITELENALNPVTSQPTFKDANARKQSIVKNEGLI